MDFEKTRLKFQTISVASPFIGVKALGDLNGFLSLLISEISRPSSMSYNILPWLCRWINAQKTRYCWSYINLRKDLEQKHNVLSENLDLAKELH
ncbi:hypothetical protein J7L29_06855, partial [Candidatus Bathyarchaeota archaeon]|nr:hypothetical protein [Candidatus Bathyarchaeota archaeon]